LTDADHTASGFVLVNTKFTAVDVTLTARSYDGALILGDQIKNPATLTVAAGSQLALTAPQAFGVGISEKAGWVELEFSADGVKGSSVIFRPGLGILDTTPLNAVPSGRLVFPKVSATAQTRLSVINTSGLSVNARISLCDNSGGLRSEIPITLAAFAGFNGSLADLAPGETLFEGYAVVESESNSLVGLETYASQEDLAAIQAVSEEDSLSIGYWPHFARLPGYSSKITLINSSDKQQVVHLMAGGLSVGGGQAAGPMFAERVLFAHQRLEESVEQIFNLSVDTPVIGYIRFETENNSRAIIGSLEQDAGNSLEALTTSEPSDAAYSDAYFPFVMEDDAHYAGLALLNPNSESANILLEFIQDNNVTASTTVTLNPGEHRARLVDEIFPQPLAYGYIRMAATLPVFGLAAVGSRDLESLVYIVAQTNADTLSTSAAAGDAPPSITSLSPSSVEVNSVPSLKVDIFGANFTNNAYIRYDGLKMRTSFISSTLLSITLSSAQLNVGSHSVQVDAPPNSTSNIAQFTVTPGAGPPNQPPVVNAGPNQTITLPASATLSGSASDDGLPREVLTTSWSKVSGPGSVTFGNAASLSTTATFSVAGAYVLQLTASDGALSSAADVAITVNAPPPTNQVPVVNAGPDQTITLPASATLSGSASDDGLPNGVLTTGWSKVSGPGSVTFGNAASLSTTATFSVAGAYVLRLTASDGALSSAANVAITVNAPPPIIQPPGSSSAYYVSTAGSDSNSGSSTSPWRTIQKAANTLSAGETVIVTSGTYNERVQITRSGSTGAPITFQADGTVVIQGFNVQASYIKMAGFEITNTPGTSPTDRSRGSAFYISGSSNEASDNYIHDSVAAGIYLTSSASYTIVTNNRIAYAVECAIYIQGSGNLIASNDISHTRSVSGSDADGVRFFGSGNTVRRNYIHDMYRSDSPGESPHIDAFQTWGPATNYVFEQNRVDKSPEQPQGFTIEGKYTPVSSIIIRNNIFITRGTGYQSDVNVGQLGTVSDVTIANNTMVSVSGAVEFAIWVQNYLQGAVIKNNVVYDHGNNTVPYIRVDAGATNIAIGTNSVYKSNGVPPVGSPYPGDLWMVNPQFVDFSNSDFHLQFTSPVIDKGTSLSSVPDDMDSVSRPLGSGYDIGAYEKK